MRKICIALTFFGACMAACTTASQATADDAKAAQLLQSRQYTFVATQANPTEDPRYSARNLFPNAPNLYQLSSKYDVKVTNDTITAYLPFFGRSYTAPMNPTEGGIKFTSTDFTYAEKVKKGNTEIEIQPKDANDVRALYLTISPGGRGTLRISTINRTPISFYGYIEPNKKGD